METAQMMQKELGIKTTGKISYKRYRCTGCGKVKYHNTNHWGEIYPYCRTCRDVTVWVCLEEMPKGYARPARWRIVKLSEVIEKNSLDPKDFID